MKLFLFAYNLEKRCEHLSASLNPALSFMVQLETRHLGENLEASFTSPVADAEDSMAAMCDH
jgi:hypothetical protein